MSKKPKRRAELRRRRKLRAASELRARHTATAEQPDHSDDNKRQQAAALLQNSQFTDARELIFAWLRTEPLNVEAWNLLTIALHHLRQGGVVDAMEQSLAIDPDQPDVLNNLGVLVAEGGDLSRGIELLEKALLLRPDFALAHGNLANRLRDVGEIERAKHHYQRALALAPCEPETLSNYAALLMDADELESAERLLRKAIEVDSSLASAWVNLGALLNRQRRLQEALSVSRRAIEIVNSPQALTNLGVALLANGDSQEGLHWLRTAAERDCSLSSNYLFSLSQSVEATEAEVFLAHREWGVRVEATIDPMPPRPTATVRSRIRIGYVSPDLREHVICRYLLPVLQQHDSRRFEVYCYGEVPHADDGTRLVRAHAHWRDTFGKTDRAVAEQIRADEIDVLIDLAGHTRGNRLAVFAYRPAPVAATWMGYPNTTGLQRIDYFVTNEFLNPRGTDDFHAEQLWRLPRNSACCLPPQSHLIANELPAARNGWITFGSLNRPNKVGERTLDLWASVLGAVERSRLIMFFPTLTGEVAERFRRKWDERGFPGDRIELRSEASRDGYLQQYHDIDIALDVTPWTGGTTIRDACWMGVAPIALCGKRRSSRGSADVLHRVGLSHLVAASVDEYVAIARALAADQLQLKQLRKELRRRVEARLCNADEFVAEFEDALIAMHEKGPAPSNTGCQS